MRFLYFSRFQTFGARNPHRPPEDVAYAVARFFQKGGSLQNYYMVCFDDILLEGKKGAKLHYISQSLSTLHLNTIFFSLHLNTFLFFKTHHFATLYHYSIIDLYKISSQTKNLIYLFLLLSLSSIKKH